MSVRERTWLVLAGALALAAGLGSRPAVAESGAERLETAFQDALTDYEIAVESKDALELGAPRVFGGWAYATAQAPAGEVGATHRDYVVLLAREARDGWQVVAPAPESLGEYEALLLAFPDDVIDPATKALLRPARQRVPNFTNHSLPWPVGQWAQVTKKNVTGHENQIDFGIDRSIYASKAGKVVFVKEVSSDSLHNCQIAPPDPCWMKANMVVIEHAPGQLSWYVHIKQNSVPVILGSWVSQGTKIAEEGNTGFSSGPHLHFMASTGTTGWTNPNDPLVAPWASGITQVDFYESTWANLNLFSSYQSMNASDPGVGAPANGQFDVFVHDQENKLRRVTYRNNAWSTTWNDYGGILTTGVDAVAVSANDVYAFVRGISNEVWYYRPLTNTWQSLWYPSSGGSSDPGVASTGPTLADVFVRGADNGIWSRTLASATWNRDPNGILSGGLDAYYCGSSRVATAVRGIDQLWHHSRTGTTWGAWEGLGNPPGGTASDPSVVCWGTRTDVFVRGGDKKLYYKTKTGSTWPSAWTPLDGVCTSGPDAVSWSSGHIAVFVRGVAGDLWYRPYNNGWGNWAQAAATVP